MLFQSNMYVFYYFYRCKPFKTFYSTLNMYFDLCIFIFWRLWTLLKNSHAHAAVRMRTRKTIKHMIFESNIKRLSSYFTLLGHYLALLTLASRPPCELQFSEDQWLDFYPRVELRTSSKSSNKTTTETLATNSYIRSHVLQKFSGVWSKISFFSCFLSQVNAWKGRRRNHINTCVFCSHAAFRYALNFWPSTRMEFSQN